MALLISEHVLQCLQDFHAASSKTHKLSDAAHQKLLDEFARFKLWAGNIGAHRKGRSSLDWRLRDASHLRDLVVDLLADLKNTLDDVSSTNLNAEIDYAGYQDAAPISDALPNATATVGGDLRKESKSFADNFKPPIPVLPDLIGIIAKGPSKQREIQEKANQDAMQVATPEAEEAKGKEKTEHTGTPAESQPSEGSLSYHDIAELDDDTEVFEIVEDMGDIIGCLLRLSTSIRNPAPHDHFMSSKFIDTSHFEEYDVEHVKAKLPRVEPCLASRLGKAVSRRRQYFKYRETHHQKLNAELDIDSKRSETGPQSTVASSIPTALKEGGSSHPAFSRVEEEEMSNSGASQTSYATSGPQSGRLKIPSLPKQASDGPFECPYCYMIISVSTTIQWKKHVNADLRPYICLEPDCLTPEQQYTRRHEWLHHMNQKHWRVFKCSYSCQEEDFTSPSHLQYHVRQFHPELSAQRDLTMIFDLCERPRPWPEETKCPLCQQALYSKREYARHVGRHQTELALFALPFNGEEEEEEEDDPDDPQQSNRRKYTTEDWSDSPESDQSNDYPVPSHAPEYLVQVPHPPEASARDRLLYKNPSPKADGLFHCPWEGQASCNHKPDKLKCNYDKFVDAHLKPYHCKACKDVRFASAANLLRHEREAHAMHGHGDKPYLCTYEGCERAVPGNGFPRMWNLRDHMRRVHNYTGKLASTEADQQNDETSLSDSSLKAFRSSSTTSPSRNPMLADSKKLGTIDVDGQPEDAGQHEVLTHLTPVLPSTSIPHYRPVREGTKQLRRKGGREGLEREVEAQKQRLKDRFNFRIKKA